MLGCKTLGTLVTMMAAGLSTAMVMNQTLVKGQAFLATKPPFAVGTVKAVHLQVLDTIISVAVFKLGQWVILKDVSFKVWFALALVLAFWTAVKPKVFQT